MQPVYHKFFTNIKNVFIGRNTIWHFVFIVLTAGIVFSGFDWFYFTATRGASWQSFAFPAVIIGFLLPVFLPLVLYCIKSLRNTANAIVQAEFLGWGLSSLYKVFTGRVGLPHGIISDTSHIFRFGFYRGGAFQGWPSSHTATAFAMAFALIALYPKNKTIKYSAFIYALYIGIGVSMTIHWFSDFIAGAILGTVIGIVVGKSFLRDRALSLH